MKTHEYAILGGANRSNVGRFIGVVSASLTSLIVFGLLLLFDAAAHLGLPQNLPPIVLSLIIAGLVFAALYFLFSKMIWQWPLLKDVLSVANVAGVWDCVGQSLNEDGSTKFDWKGIVTITQDWDKIRIHLKTETSGSNSIAAAFVLEHGTGYRLLYHYQNEPRIGEPELNSHRGFCDLCIAADGKTAEGDYFNGFGRVSFGRMRLVRR